MDLISHAVPGSKSYTNRALLVAALAKGTSVLHGVLESDDTRYMRKALEKLGIQVKGVDRNALEVKGRGGIFLETDEGLFLGNAGTAVRFLTAALATQDFETTVTGNDRMKERPIKDLADALETLGVEITYLEKPGFPPLTIKGPLNKNKTTVSGSMSSQYLSALLITAPYAEEEVQIRIQGTLVSKPYVEMTEELMKIFGAEVIEKDGAYNVSPKPYEGRHYIIEGDASSASYFWGLAAITRSTVCITNIPARSKQADMGFLQVLKKMGCTVEEKVEGICVTGPDTLQALGIIDLEHMPDAAMTVAVLCAFTYGVSELRGLYNLRVKECDRLAALTVELTKIGIKVYEHKDGLTIHGDPTRLVGTNISTYDDHRMAMCFAMAQTRVPELVIENPDCVSKTYPDFWADLKSVRERIMRQKNIVLTGMRGSGKSTLGKLLATGLKRDFIDIDTFIEEKAQRPITEIVAEYGWDHFRALEREVVQELCKQNGLIIATGGGTLMYTENVHLLRKNGFIILLDAPLKLLKKRLQKDYERPGLTGDDAHAELETIWSERESTYRLVADMRFIVTDIAPEEETKTLLKNLI